MDKKQTLKEEIISMAKDRMKICDQCPKFINLTNQCKVCKCFMPLKVLFKKMKCPDDPPRW